MEYSVSRRMEQAAKKFGLASFTAREISKLPKPILIDRFLQSNP
jgi:hypothetical protein